MVDRLLDAQVEVGIAINKLGSALAALERLGGFDDVCADLRITMALLTETQAQLGR